LTTVATITAKPGRRKKGEGGAYFDKYKKLWYGSYTRADGTPAKTRGQATEDEAVQAARDQAYEERHGLRPREQNHRRTVGDVLDAWVETFASQLPTASTRGEYVRQAQKIRDDRLGRRHLEELDYLDVVNYANGLRKTLRHATVRKYITVLQMALRMAVRQRWVATNVAERISIPRDADPRQVDGYTAEEGDRLLTAAVGRSMEHMLVLGIWAGLRKGEFLGLRWRDIDVAKQRLNVRQTLVWRSGQSQPEFKSLMKSAAGRRSFPLLPVVAEALENQRARVAQLQANAGDLWQEHDLVFPNEIGAPIYPSNVNRELAIIEQLAGIEHHRVHDWRHTAATKMLGAGVPDRIVMEVCGWSDRTMLDRYQHVRDEDLDEFLDRMVVRHPAAAGTGVLQMPTRSKFAGRPHSRRSGDRLEAAQR
jgi:integrase